MDAYFKVESISALNRVTFKELKTRLIRVVNSCILNGEFTERGLARILGVSQPQIHNVLKGARKLHVDLADRLLARLEMTVADLIEYDEFAEQHRHREHAKAEHRIPEPAGGFGARLSTPRKPPEPELHRTRRTEGIAI